MVRPQEKILVVGGPPPVYVDQEHDHRDGQPHEEDHDDVEEEHPDNFDVLVESNLFVLRERALATVRRGGHLRGEATRPRDEDVRHAELGLTTGLGAVAPLDLHGADHDARRGPSVLGRDDLVEDALVMVDQHDHGEETGEDDDRHDEAGREVDVGRFGKDESADSLAVVGGELAEPEGDGNEDDGC